MIVVNAGNVIPADGVIVNGAALIDQHLLTGESQPQEKGQGEAVLAATLVQAGRISIEVRQAGAKTVAAQLAEVLAKTADYREELESRGEQLADQAALPTLGLGGLALATVSVEGAVAVLGSNYLDNMRIAVPIAMLNYLNQATKLGILIKDGRVLDLLKDIDTVVFDKTGTLTDEQPCAADIVTCPGYSADTVLGAAAAAENRQVHPIARAILQAAAARGLQVPSAKSPVYHAGHGIQVQLTTGDVLVGSERFMVRCGIALTPDMYAAREVAQGRGSTMVFVAIAGQLAGAIELRPQLRPEVPALMGALRQRGLSLCILSGDHAEPTRHLAAKLGIEEFFAEVLPQEKAAIIESLRRAGRKVCFVGDGLNDALALRQAQASISLSGATTIATDAAQVVLLDGTLRQIPHLVDLARDYDRNTNNGYKINLIPTLICSGGIFFLGFGIYHAVLLYNISLLFSVVNAMSPALKRHSQLTAPAEAT